MATQIPVHHLANNISRKDLRTDAIYVEADGNAAHSPDGTGVVWHEDLNTAMDETGLMQIIHCNVILDY